MPSTVDKGKVRVKEFMDKYYIPNRWRCWKSGNKATWILNKKWFKDKSQQKFIVVSQSQDIFECYDFVATKKNHPLHAVQVTSITPREGATGDDIKGIISLVTKRRAKIEELGIQDGTTWSIVTAREPRKEPRIWMNCLPRGGEWTEVPLEHFIRNFLV